MHYNLFNNLSQLLGRNGQGVFWNFEKASSSGMWTKEMYVMAIFLLRTLLPLRIVSIALKSLSA